jgi:hypothetical protein
MLFRSTVNKHEKSREID